MDELAADACRWFLANAHPGTGLVLDRAPNLEGGKRPTEMASIAASGFYLALLPEMSKRSLLPEHEAAGRAGALIEFVSRSVENVNGILPHFLNWGTGKRWGNSEYSVLDTSIFLHGCIVAAKAYDGIGGRVDELLDRVDWSKLWIFSERHRRWLMSYGYRPDRTPLPSAAVADVRSSENLMPCLLAAGSRTKPLGAECWYHTRIDRWDGPGPATRANDPSESYEALRQRVINPAHPLFTSQYGLLWADLKGLHDADGIDLWSNARVAALMNRAYCRDIAARRFRTYDESEGGWWGLSAGDGPHGYVVRDAVKGDPDGAVWPTAAMASVSWIHEELSEDFKRWKASRHWKHVRGRYALAPFSLDLQWTGRDALGIDLGCFACSFANWRDGAIHRLWSDHPVTRTGMRNLEFSRP